MLADILKNGYVSLHNHLPWWQRGAPSKAPGLILKSTYCLEDPVSFSARVPHVCLGSLRVVWFPPTSHKHASRWMGFDKFPLDVNVCEGARAWYPAMDWGPI